MVAALIRSLRVHQWAKNLFVVAFYFSYGFVFAVSAAVVARTSPCSFACERSNDTHDGDVNALHLIGV